MALKLGDKPNLFDWRNRRLYYDVNDSPKRQNEFVSIFCKVFVAMMGVMVAMVILLCVFSGK